MGFVSVHATHRLATKHLDYTTEVTEVLSSSSRLQNHSQALSENKPGVYGGPLIESGPPADWHLWGVLRNGYCYLEVTDS